MSWFGTDLDRWLAIAFLALGLVFVGVGAFLGWRLLAGVRGHGVAAVAVAAFVGTLVFAGTWALAATALAGRVSAALRRARTDGAERLLAVATAGLTGGRGEWAAGMRAELATLDDPRERRRFARGCSRAALRHGSGRVPAGLVLGTGLVFAAGTFAASRLAFGGDGPGILGWVTVGTPQLVLVGVGLWAAWSAGSFRVGLETGTLALLAALIGYLAVVMPESAYWYDRAGVYVLDGDPPKGGVDTAPALDPLGPVFLGAVLLLWSPCAVIGAELGARLAESRAARRPTPEPVPA